MTDALEAWLDELTHDLPTISDAFKTLLAHELAQAHIEQRMAFGSADVAGALAAVRAVLSAINALKLPSPVEYGMQFPQADAQSGFDRMDQIAKYRVAYALAKSLQGSATKPVLPSKALGRKYLTIVWPMVKSSIASEADPAVKLVVAAVEASLSDGGSTQSPPASQLVWSADVDATLAQRHAQRKVDAATRQAEAEAEARAVVQAALQQGAGDFN